MNAPLVHERVAVRRANLTFADEAKRIDSWVREQQGATPFHLPCWLNAIERGTGNKAYCLVAENEAGDIAGLVPLHAVGSPLFGRALVSSGFAVGGGILARSQGVADGLADAVWDLAVELKCPTTELRGGAVPHQGWIVKSDAHANFERALAADDEAELLAIPRKQRAEVRKGLDKGLKIETGNGQRDLDWHYRVYAESVRNLGTPVFPRALMAETLKAFGNDADILTVLSDGKPVASVLSLYFNGAVMPYWGGGVWEARALRANDVMYYALMNHGRRRGCTRFDFGRSKVDSGAYFFKKNWGFEPEPLSYSLRTADGSEPRDVNPNSAKYRSVVSAWQKLPLPIANLIGPWISKGLG
ncbi:FemAB family XrtA/PEP-CTERM system-associated protein [uncultured Sphingorhabdus sp.]|uniref:FemAB family XrtA/PEP-CTERM system-associated protein n=1 Tax=uncultured Sphingorhabdus sp. TaxID=1686106 RepID=UPI00260E8501|nr:FemAB family XrtA/PEP-CTERM system-associated protein [uncultured Sphingorhabdus sp.]HMS19697.1 FemAB family PEP-CTERM system-associated protein [Sphingorhabdus sp.]